MIVRKFKNEDVQKIRDLCDHILVKSPHFIRDESFINYSVRSPSVSQDGILIAEANNQIVGFAVISIVEENWVRGGSLIVGSVVELQCMDSHSFLSLIQAVEKYCASKNVDTIVVPHTPFLASISMLLKEWLKVEKGVMMVKPVSFLPLLQLLLRDKKVIQGKTIALCIDDETIQVIAEKVQVMGFDDFKRSDIQISLSSKTLIGVMFNQLSPLFSWLSGKIRIKHITNVPLALKVLNELKLSSSPYVSPGDMI